MYKYIENPTYTISKLVPQNKAELTAMTICPMGRNDGYKESILKDHGIMQYSSHDCSSNMTWSSRNTSLSENDIFENVTLKFDELVDSIKLTRFRGLNVSKSSRSFPWISIIFQDLFFKKATTNFNEFSNLIHEYIQEQRHNEYGKCYTFYPKCDIQGDGIKSITFKL